MAKRNKKIITNRRPKMKVEALESRQLLATDIAGADEVASDVFVASQGNTFDQLLMTGSTATFKNDPGQITRLALQDVNEDGSRGEIIQIEASGEGTFTVSLTGFQAAAEPSGNYNQAVQYVAGKATVTIEQSNSNSNLSVYALGPATDFSPGGAEANPIFQDANGDPLNADYGQADLQAVIVVNNPNGGGDLFGSFFGGNALFSGDTGVVGINAPGTNFIGRVAIGGLHATDAAAPALDFGGDQFGTLNIVGGSIVNDSVNPLDTTNTEFSANFVDGITAAGDPLRASTTGQAVLTGAAIQNLTIAPEMTFDFTGKSQADIDEFAKGRTFVNDVTFTGDLPDFFSLSAQEFRGSVQFMGNIDGSFSVTQGGIQGDLLFEKGISGNGAINLNNGNVSGLTRFGSADNGADLGSPLNGGHFGDIQIWGDQTAAGTIDIDGFGNLVITGNSSATIFSEDGGGDVLVGGDVTGTTFLQSDGDGDDDGFFKGVAAVGGVNGDGELEQGAGAFGSFGDITVEGDVLGGGDFLQIFGNGTFGDINILGGGGDDQVIGNIDASGTTGGIFGTNEPAGAISITGSAGKDVSLGDVIIPASSSQAGITVNGGSGSDSLLTTGGSLAGVFTTTGFEDFTHTGSFNLDATVTLDSGDGSVANINGDNAKGASLTVSGAQDNDVGAAAALAGSLTLTADGDKDARFDIADGALIEQGLTGSGFRIFTSGDSEINGDLILTTTTSTSADEASILFEDGFLSDDVSAWSLSVPTELDNDGDPVNGKVTLGNGGGGGQLDIAGFTDGSLTVTATDIVIDDLINVDKALGTVTLNGDVATTDAGGFKVDEGVTSLTINGKLTADGDTFLTNDEKNDIASFTVTGKTEATESIIVATKGSVGDVSIEELDQNGGTFINVADDDEGVGTITATKAIDTTGGLFVTADGSLGSLTADDAVTLNEDGSFVLGGDIGDIVIGGVLTIAGMGTVRADSITSLATGGLDTSGAGDAAIKVDDGTSGADAIGDITIEGQVMGRAGTDIQASSIGDITINGALGSNDVLIDSFNVLATPNGLAGGGATNEDVDDGLIEQVDLNGTNLEDYSIGDIKITTDISASNPAPTYIFSGDNTFAAMGNLGNITIETGSSLNNTKFSSLFMANTDGAWFSAGDGDGSLVDGDDTLDAGSEGIFGLEGDTTDGAVVLAALDPLYTGGTVSVGNVRVVANQTDNATNLVSEVDNVAGGVASSATVEGFAVLSGVSTIDGDVFIVNGAGTDVAVNAAVIDADLGGKIGTVAINSNTSDGFVDDVADVTTIDGTANAEVAGILAASSVDTLFGTSIKLTATGEAAIFGDVDSAGDDTVEDDPNQLIVAVI